MRWAVLAALLSGSLSAQPCSQGTAACTEPFPLAEGRFVTLYRSHPLAGGHSKARRALIVIHGAGRNADDYFASGMAGAFLANALDETVVLAPRFAGAGAADCADALAPAELGFACVGDDWRGGGPGAGAPGITSYDVVDELIRRLADKRKFPLLRHIVLLGHSAGGQFISRYAAAAKAEPPGVAIRYMIANPSSYLYLDVSRPGPTAGCPAFNQWKYGLENRTGYAAAVPDEALVRNLVRRDVVYLLGEYDVTPQFGFDSSCGAMAQGPNRLQRGLDYFNYITTRYGARHRLVRVPSCGHNGRCMLVANEARQALFP